VKLRLGFQYDQLLRDILNLVYPSPKPCLLCGRPESEPGRIGLCAGCQQAIAESRRGTAICSKCGKFLECGGGSAGGPNSADGPRVPVAEGLCRDCRNGGHPFEIARAVGPYEGVLKEGIEKLKFSGCRELGIPFGRLMARVVASDPGFVPTDLVVPVPLHRERLRERNFNQAELLATALAGELFIPLNPHLLVREIRTGIQSKLGRAERRLNLAGAFRVSGSGSAELKNILLVDDIYTTGATVGECARVLLNAGAKGVNVIALAAGKQAAGIFPMERE